MIHFGNKIWYRLFIVEPYKISVSLQMKKRRGSGSVQVTGRRIFLFVLKYSKKGLKLPVLIPKKTLVNSSADYWVCDKIACI